MVESITTPSMRKRTRMSPWRGSKWMSEAPRVTASAITVCTSLTTGASSADSRSSMTWAGVLLLGLVDLLHRLVEARELADHGLDVLGGGHRAAHLVAGGHLDVVERDHVRRVGGGHQQGALAA